MLPIPENKVVVVIPDYDSYVEINPEETDGPIVIPPSDETDKPTTDPKPAETDKPTTDPVYSGTKELLTKGDDNTVPALPTLPSTEDGNFFEGWVDKATGEPVHAGDKVTGNVELVPVWKDCGDDQHADGDEDQKCDECGHNLATEPEETTPNTGDETGVPETGENSGPESGEETSGDQAPDDEKPGASKPGDDTPDNGSPAGIIGAVIGSIGVLAALAAALIVFLKKKKSK